MDKVVVWGQGLMHPKTFKTPTHRINGIYIDSLNSDAVISIQKGIEVNQVKVSIEELQDIGFLDFNKLEKYCK
jgi:hypothetical protein